MFERTNAVSVVVSVLLLTAAGCLKDAETSVLDRLDGHREQPEAGSGGPSPLPPGQDRPPTPGAPAPGGPGSTPSVALNDRGICKNGGWCTLLQTQLVRSLDLLFVIDNSPSMRMEQAALREQFPRLIVSLTSGRRADGSVFPPVQDLHLGVVSTDMGLVGIPNDYPGCNTPRHLLGGDDGLLQHSGDTGPGCASAYPPFLSFVQGRDNPEKLAQDFSCIANLGITGCGFRQPLEAALKALWPKHYIDASGEGYPVENNPVRFLSATPENQFGHGDTAFVLGETAPWLTGNADFLRTDPQRGISHLAIILVTDGEDCSSKTTTHFIQTTDPENPLSRQAGNLRCFYNKQNLFEIQRYVLGYRALRPNFENHLTFGAIVGVPPELVSPDARAPVDFSDPVQRDAYYDMILADPRMIERPQNENVPPIANVAPSCSRTDWAGERADAYPPNRIVQVAKGLGEDAIVQSICQDDFTPVSDAILQNLTGKFQGDCFERLLSRGHDGKVKCDVIWELPARNSQFAGPYECDERPFLSSVASPRKRTNPSGGRNCKVNQLPVTVIGQTPMGDGFFYDDFSVEQGQLCKDEARIAFSPNAKVPAGVKAFLDCSKDAE